MIHLEKEGTFVFPMDAVYTMEIYGPPGKASGHNKLRMKVLESEFNTFFLFPYLRILRSKYGI